MQITMNLNPGGVPPTIHVVQGDNNGKNLTITLLDGATDYAIPDNASVVWQGTKPDQYGFSYDCTFDGNTITVPITTQSTAVAGMVNCELMISEGEDSNIRSTTAAMIVAPSAVTDDTIMSGNDYQSAANLAAAAQNSATAASASAEFSANSATEATTKATAAAESATSAASSATNAAASESAAETSKTSAETAAANAATSAANAATSASAAASSATSAAASAELASTITHGQKGWYATQEALEAAWPSGECTDGNWAIVGTTDTIWVYDTDTNAWQDSHQATDLSNYPTNEQADAKFATKMALSSATDAIDDIIDGTTSVARATTATTATSASSATTAGTANNALNGIQTYTHSYDSETGIHTLSGYGVNGKFKADVSGIITSPSVGNADDGYTTVSVVQGDDTEIEITEGKWYTFIVDTDEGTINFPSASGFRVVGSETQPNSANKNTIWINTATPIGNVQMGITDPTAREDGTDLQDGDIYIWLTILGVKQYIDGAWVWKRAKMWTGAIWKSLMTVLYYDGVDYGAGASWATTLTKTQANGGTSWGHRTVEEEIDVTTLNHVYFEANLLRNASSAANYYYRGTGVFQDGTSVRQITGILASTTGTTVVINGSIGTLEGEKTLSVGVHAYNNSAYMNPGNLYLY